MVIAYCPEIEFHALQGYNQKQLLELYRNSKVYMDFGTFPGAERVPKEAVVNGCSVLTGLYGASGYYNDVPLPKEYKIEANVKNLPLIKEKLLIRNGCTFGIQVNYQRIAEYLLRRIGNNGFFHKTSRHLKINPKVQTPSVGSLHNSGRGKARNFLF